MIAKLESLLQYFLTKVRILPWAQFVGTWLASLALLVWALSRPGAFSALAHGVAVVGSVLALAASATSAVYQRRVAKAPWKSLLKLSSLLQLGGLAVAALAAFYLSLPVEAHLVFVGLGVSQAGQWYDEVYP